MSETPEWALKRARELSPLGESVLPHFAAYIAQHEQPPVVVDPLVEAIQATWDYAKGCEHMPTIRSASLRAELAKLGGRIVFDSTTSHKTSEFGSIVTHGNPAAQWVQGKSDDPYGPEIPHEPGQPCPYPGEVGMVRFADGRWEWPSLLSAYSWGNMGDGSITAYRLRAGHPHYTKPAVGPVRAEAERLFQKWVKAPGTGMVYTLETAIRRGMEMAQPVPPTDDQLRELLAGVFEARGAGHLAACLRSDRLPTGIDRAALDHLRKHVAAIREATHDTGR